MQIISSSGGQIIAVQNPALALSESLSIKTTVQSHPGGSSPLSKTKKDDSAPNSIGPVSSSLISERQTIKTGANSLHLPHLQQAPSSLYRNAYSLNNPALIENTSAVATLLNLSRRGAARQAAATLSDSLNSTHDKTSSLGNISSDRESPSSSSSTACTTSSGYPRSKRNKRSENNDESDPNDGVEGRTATKVQRIDKDKEDACDIDENFLGEVKQEPMSPQGVSPPRSDPSTLEASFNSNAISHPSTPLTRHSARTKLKNE